MSTHTADTSTELPCYRCGYDLRAHPPEGKCPECQASVAESRRLAMMPLRPAWRDSDPRWRRRMLAGVWILVLLLLVEVLQATGLASSIPAPNLFHFPYTNFTLDSTFLYNVDEPVLFCTGVVLLFSKERGRRCNRLDWTRRWGIICSYLTFLLSAVQLLLPTALIGVGVTAIFLSMPRRFQPGITNSLGKVSTYLLRYVVHPRYSLEQVMVAVSSVTVLLACVPLYNALLSTCPNRLEPSHRKRFAAIFIVPLALFSLMQISVLGLYHLGFPGLTVDIVYYYYVYFEPGLLFGDVAALAGNGNFSGLQIIACIAEGIKWCTVLAIAIRLTIAQVATWRQRKKPAAAPPF